MDWQSTSHLDMPRLIRASHEPVSPAVHRERERDRSPVPSHGGGLAVQPGWRTASELSNLGLPFHVVQSIESWCWERSLNSHVIDFRPGRTSAIVTMHGDCFFCKKPDGVNPHQHHSNHWVIMATPGFTTVRVRCHSSCRVENTRAPFVQELLGHL